METSIIFTKDGKLVGLDQQRGKTRTLKPVMMQELLAEDITFVAI